MSSVDTTIWPNADTVPVGQINPGNGRPFAVLRPLGRFGGVGIQFMPRVEPPEQARYLRALAEVANRLADQLDQQDGAKP